MRTLGYAHGRTHTGRMHVGRMHVGRIRTGRIRTAGSSQVGTVRKCSAGVIDFAVIFPGYPFRATGETLNP
jgi:hypothetical protein